MYEIFSDVPPNQNSGAAPAYSILYILYSYIYVVTCAPPPKFLYVADPMQTHTQSTEAAAAEVTLEP